jgi:hypothetical protein
MLHEYGEVPPVAASVVVGYAVPAVPLGTELVEMASGVVVVVVVVVVVPEVMLNEREFVVPAFGTTTFTVTVPAADVRPPHVEAVSCVLLTNVVVSCVPFHWMYDPDTKPVPFTVSETVPDELAEVLVGDKEVSEIPVVVVVPWAMLVE